MKSSQRIESLETCSIYDNNDNKLFILYAGWGYRLSRHSLQNY